MIDAKDLRIGNVIFCDTANQLCIVKRICEGEIDAENDINLFMSFDLDRFSGVVLTEEILLKCGFEILKDGGLSHDGLSKFEIDFIFNSKGFRIEYLHQLQNLYFALTGEELEFKP